MLLVRGNGNGVDAHVLDHTGASLFKPCEPTAYRQAPGHRLIAVVANDRREREMVRRVQKDVAAMAIDAGISV